LTTDPFILKCLKGIELEFYVNPEKVTSKEKWVFPLGATKDNIHNEVMKLLDKQVIEKCSPCKGQILSSIFLTPKPNGSHRVIFNMKSLNKALVYRHFKMDSFDTAKSLLRPGWRMASVDLKDAYFTIPVAEDHKKYLRFKVSNCLYQFRAMPQGLSSAPRIFTKIMKPVMASLRLKGIICMAYLDDTLIVAESAEKCSDGVNILTRNLQDLGFVINFEKSQFIPTKQLTFLGYTLDSDRMTVTLPQDKVFHLTNLCTHLINRPTTSIQKLSEVIGTLLL